MAAKTQTVAVKKKSGKKAMAKAPAPAGPLMSWPEDFEKAFERFAAGWPMMSPYFQALRDWDPFKDIHLPLSLSRMSASPRVDVGETAEAYEITAEVPGMEEKDIEVTMSDGTLVLKGEKRDERDTKEKDYHLTERSYGAFRRALRIPEGVEADRVSATFKNGVLKITLPKSKEARSKQRKITVRSG